MSKLDIRIRPATHQDLEACAICWGNRRDTYPSIYPLRLVKTSVTRGQRLARNTRDLEKMLNDSTNDFRVAIASDPASEMEGTIVGYSIWAKPEGFQRDYEAFAASTLSDLEASAPQDQIEGEADPECNHELAAKLKEEGMHVKQRFSEGKRFWLLQQLFIREDWQRRGIGKTLIEDGLSMIEQLESSRASDHSSSKTYKVGLTSSPQGKALYERYGFKDVYWFNPIFDDIDEQGKEIVRDVRWPLMIKQ